MSVAGWCCASRVADVDADLGDSIVGDILVYAEHRDTVERGANRIIARCS